MLKFEQFVGQWLGFSNRPGITGSAAIILNLEIRDNELTGRLNTNPSGIPQIIHTAQVKLQIIDGSLEGQLFNFIPFHVTTGKYETLVDMRKIYPELAYPALGHIKAKLGPNGELIGNMWSDHPISTDPVKDSFQLQKGNFSQPTESNERFESWSECRDYILKLLNRHRSPIFRGQQNSKWRLRTSFHRHNKSDVFRYHNDEIYQYHHAISALCPDLLDPGKPYELGILLNIAQHHGFPTPLLDWTESPFVAAYFAFANLPKDTLDGYVRIFVFDIERWEQKTGFTINDVSDPRLTIVRKRFLARNNPRALPQQSILTYTNVDDIEGFISWIEQNKKTKYLLKLDIPAKERNNVMNELRYMGVTAASLFPGIDGISEALREQLF